MRALGFFFGEKAEGKGQKVLDQNCSLAIRTVFILTIYIHFFKNRAFTIDWMMNIFELLSI